MVKKESRTLVSDYEEIYSMLNGKYSQHFNAAVTKTNSVCIFWLLNGRTSRPHSLHFP